MWLYEARTVKIPGAVWDVVVINCGPGATRFSFSKLFDSLDFYCGGFALQRLKINY